MNIVNFEELQVGDYFRCPQDPGISAGYDYSYEIDWCPPDMKVVKVDRPESFK